MRNIRKLSLRSTDDLLHCNRVLVSLLSRGLKPRGEGIVPFAAGFSLRMDEQCQIPVILSISISLRIRLRFVVPVPPAVPQYRRG